MKNTLNNTLNNTLKPCPLCGGKAIIDRLEHGRMLYKATIKCQLCGLTLDWETEYARYVCVTGDEFIVRTSITPKEAWNRRAT